MIRKAEQTKIRDLFNIDNIVTYSIPQYQREYTWTKELWEKLFNDIYENDSPYFLGSIMSVADEVSPKSQEYEVIDGQQRMITISLLFAAIFGKLSEKDVSLENDQKDELNDLKRRLINRDKIRLIPQIQGNNRDDYNALLCDLNLCTCQKPHNAGKRKIFKAYKFFYQNMLEEIIVGKSDEERIKSIFEILQKVLDAVVVNIIVENYSDASMMFESLNDRGEPLSAIDLIKNSLLARFARNKSESSDIYQKWIKFINYLSDDPLVQERFFRQYYNAFTDDYKNVSFKVATRSNLIRIYEIIIRDNPDKFIENMLNAGRIYSHIICNQDIDDKDYLILRKSLLDLAHIQGAPSYVLLLYLFIKQNEHELNDGHILTIIDCLVKFSVRRNITNYPATYELPSLFKEIINSISDKKSDDVVNTVINALISKSPSDEQFSEKLNGAMYVDNGSATRFILCYIEEQYMTKETKKDLWIKQDGKKYLWTIEHIFPEGDNPPKCWVDMIANGDKDKAKELLTSHAHKLGNLSITVFNSSLSNRPFVEKRDLKDKGGLDIGYRNGIKLNEDLIIKDSWLKEDIDERTKKIVNMAMELFKY